MTRTTRTTRRSPLPRVAGRTAALVAVVACSVSLAAPSGAAPTADVGGAPGDQRTEPDPALGEREPAGRRGDSLTATVRRAMIDAQGTAAREVSESEPMVERIRGTKGWQLGTTTLPLSEDADHQSPRTSVFLARKQGDVWQVELDGTAAFVRLARQAPRSVVSRAELSTFRQYQRNRSEQTRDSVSSSSSSSDGASSTSAAQTGLGLPWPQGQSWSMGGGPHGNSGSSRPFNSIDFNGGDGWVRSAGSGRVYKSCVNRGSALVTVIHDNGMRTSYYHMTNLTSLADGSSVSTSTRLGRIGNELPCGGSSSGAHVHFSLYQGQQELSVDNQTIGGWTFQEGSSAYQGYAQRGSSVVYPGRGRITNYGATGAR